MRMAGQKEQFLDFDEHKFLATFNREPMLVRHHLVDHPLFALDRLAQLADFLSARQVEHNLGNVPDVASQDGLPRLAASPGSIVRGIADNGCWIGLRQVESDPEYRELLETTLAEVTGLVPEGGVLQMEAYIFLSAPNATTPVHLDPEHNLLLQIGGNKTVVIGRHDDRDTEQRAIEAFHGATVHHQDHVPDAMKPYELTPGIGVYVPVHAPHLVRNGAGPSISFSITWNTTKTDRDAAIHKVNYHLRKLGISPTPVGTHPMRDSLKQATWRGSRTVVRALRSRFAS